MQPTEYKAAQQQVALAQMRVQVERIRHGKVVIAEHGHDPRCLACQRIGQIGEVIEEDHRADFPFMVRFGDGGCLSFRGEEIRLLP